MIAPVLPYISVYILIVPGIEERNIHSLDISRVGDGRKDKGIAHTVVGR